MYKSAKYPIIPPLAGSAVYTLAAVQGSGLQDISQDQFDDETVDHNQDIVDNGLGQGDDDVLTDDEEEDIDNGAVTLDALEAEELETVETNESATMLVDEAFEIKAIRRREMALDAGAQARRGDEFVCRSCFLVLKNVQLADRENMFCVDCV